MRDILGLRPTKIIGIHLNYQSRIDEFGAKPELSPTYFLKPPSALARTGDAVVRSSGCKYLNYEGEVAAVIGRAARCVSVESSLDYVRGYTLANDFSSHDFRHADRGSMLRVKGQDGYCPIGPTIVELERHEVERIEFRTMVNGALVQEGSTSEWLFALDYLVADLARFITLEPDDVILTGTPAHSRPAEPGDVVAVEAPLIGRLENVIVEASELLLDVGVMPADSRSASEVALGRSVPVETR
jgi:5-oxopent-3-ene-1,2,5-tricarboxylate decarboxylase / 2-hydroxyhepta-2,4-diene-1,7-dioate isomerase